MAPAWQRLRDCYASDRSVVIADVSCDTDAPVCGQFPARGTPRIFWTTAGVASAEQYLGEQSYESFLSFISEKIADPVTLLHSREDYLRVQATLPHLSLFFLQEPGNSTESFLVNYSAALRGKPVRFFKFNYTEFESSKLVYRWTLMNYTIEFENPLNDTNALAAFIDVNALPPMTNATAQLMNIMLHMESVVFFYQGVDVAFDDNITELSKQFPPLLKGGLLDCHANDKACRLFGINPLFGTQLVLVKPRKNVYYTFEGDFSNEKVMSWILSAFRGWEKARGPGAGLSGAWFNFKISWQDREFRQTFITRAVIGVGAAAVLIFAIVRLRRWASSVEAREKNRVSEAQIEREAADMVAEMARQELVFAKRKLE
jgi:hypothetical protein